MLTVTTLGSEEGRNLKDRMRSRRSNVPSPPILKTYSKSISSFDCSAAARGLIPFISVSVIESRELDDESSSGFHSFKTT